MIDLTREQPLSTPAAAVLLHTDLVGIKRLFDRGLERVKLGGRFYTSREAIQRFAKPAPARKRSQRRTTGRGRTIAKGAAIRRPAAPEQGSNQQPQPLAVAGTPAEKLAATFAIRRSMYPWDEWANGEVWELERGRDFAVSVGGLSSSVYGYAKRFGLAVRFSRRGGRVRLQFLPRAEKADDGSG
jgi:hypothetical protein